MRKYSTISVPREVKAALEKHKGDMSWGQYLMELYHLAEERKRRRALETMRKLLTDEDCENLRRSSEDSLERF